MNMRYILAGTLALCAATDASAAVGYTEVTDFPNSSGFGIGSESIGTLTTGRYNVRGGLSGTCIGDTYGNDCNSAYAGDTQDSFLFYVNEGSLLESLTINATASGVDGLRYALNLRRADGFESNFSPLTPGQSFSTAINAGPGVYSLSIYGGRSSLPGKYGLSYDLALFATSTTAVPEPATWALMLVGFGMAGTALRRRKRIAVDFA